MLPGRNPRLPSPSDEAAHSAGQPGAVTAPISRVAHTPHTPHVAQIARESTAARAVQAVTAGTRVHRRRWPRIALGVLIAAVLGVVLLVPPQSLRATLATLMIVVALGIVVWRLPMTDDE